MIKYLHDYENKGFIPPHIRLGFENYLIHGIYPGGFVEALICNNFIGAIKKADSTNKNHLHDIADWMLYNMPTNCYGNREIMKNWIDDVDNIRSEYVKVAKEKKFWDTIQK
jgi:hypothetical protein